MALAKFCLVDEATAKKCVPLFVQELGRATNAAVGRTDLWPPSTHIANPESQVLQITRQQQIHILHLCRQREIGLLVLQVRNNIMVALTDMTVQYTVLVDAHIPRLAACLADPNELVRRQALALLASLLSRVASLRPLHTLRCSMPQAS